MPKALSPFYNRRKSLKHRILKRPIFMRAAYQHKVKNPLLTVIFLHGISATSETWRATFRQLVKTPELKKVRLIVLDLLGYGKSLQTDWLDYDYTDYNQALAQTLRKMQVTGPVVLVGHSMGSLIAADFATNFQHDAQIVGLILVSPPVLMPEELAKLPDRVYTKSYGALQQLAKDEPAMEVIANFVQRFSSFSSKYIKTPAFGRAMDQIILNRNNFHTFTQIRIPTLIIHGHFDPLVMASNLKHVAKANGSYVRFVSVMGHHDVSSAKRSKILIEIKRIIHEEL